MASDATAMRLRWLILSLALVTGGWLAFDGAHAFLTGDYVTPASGRHAGQLGPWAEVVSAAGIEPRSNLMKGIHLGLGSIWLGAALGLGLKLPASRQAVLVCALLGLWYLPFGTLLSLAQIALLFRLSRIQV